MLAKAEIVVWLRVCWGIILSVIKGDYIWMAVLYSLLMEVVQCGWDRVKCGLGLAPGQTQCFLFGKVSGS